jgi:hypothetical protein
MHINFENSMYYFFSAIPQVLGALAGLLGVFLLFKFQSLNKSIISFGEQILDKMETISFLININDPHLRHSQSNLKDAIIRNDQETAVSQVAAINYNLDLKDKADTLMHPNAEERIENKGLLSTFKIIENIQWSCLEFKDNLSQSSKRLFFNCATVIILSLVCLPFVPLLNNGKYQIILLLIALAILFWFGVCVFKIAWTVIMSLSHDYNDEKMPSKKGIFDEILRLFKKRKKIVYKRQWPR